MPPSESQGKPPRVAVADPSGGTAHPRCCLFVVACHLVLATRAAPHHRIAPTSLGGLTTSRARKSPVKRHPRAQVAMRISVVAEGRSLSMELEPALDAGGWSPTAAMQRRIHVWTLDLPGYCMGGKPQTCWYIRGRRARVCDRYSITGTRTFSYPHFPQKLRGVPILFPFHSIPFHADDINERPRT